MENLTREQIQGRFKEAKIMYEYCDKLRKDYSWRAKLWSAKMLKYEKMLLEWDKENDSV